MKAKNKIFLFLAAILAVVGFASCDSYLDVEPDNRTHINTEDKVVELLVSAYPTSDHLLVTELMSDNVDTFGDANPNGERFGDQVYGWEDITESNNEATEQFWGDYYRCVDAANTALEAIAKFEEEAELNGTDISGKLREAKAEALLCRAYAHFLLVNLFSMHYNSATASTDLGIPYIEEPEKVLAPQYERGSVADVYAKIDRDLQAALPNIGTNPSNYSVPKYHFSKKAAYAFATRFYLYYEKPEEALKYANACLGSDPSSDLRDYAGMASMTQTWTAVSYQYISADEPSNLLLHTGYSAMGLVFGPYYYYKRYAHTPFLSRNETLQATHPWGSAGWRNSVKTYSGQNLSCVIWWKLPYIFEYTDPVARIGFYHTIYPAFTMDQVLIDRAEIYTLLHQYDAAAADLNTWLSNIRTTRANLTPARITSFYNGVAYSYDDTGMNSTVKKHLNPAFSIDAEGSTQECMLQAVLNCRRIETIQQGVRWFDVKRYGIEIVRRQIDNYSGQPSVLLDKLTVNDKRRAIQIPLKSRDAGMQANPR